MRTLAYELTDDDYIAFNRQVYDTAPGFLTLTRRNRRFGAGVFLVLGLMLALLRDWPLVLLAALLAVGWWFGWPWLQRRSIESQLRGIAKAGSLGRTGRVTLSWDDARVYEQFHGAGSYTEWWRVERVEETADHVFLVLGQADAVIVPKRVGIGVAELAGQARALSAAGRPRPPIA